MNTSQGSIDPQIHCQATINHANPSPLPWDRSRYLLHTDNNCSTIVLHDMDVLERLRILSSEMSLEPAEEAKAPPRLSPADTSGCSAYRELPEISHAILPNGRQIALLKTLQTSACERNCFYCPFRAGRDFKRATLKPDELAGIFMGLVRGGVAQGIFLSSGLAGSSIRTQDQMIATAEILRNRFHYTGYIHLKLMPGAEKDQVFRSMQLADRVSVNLEAPNTQRLVKLAPRKAFTEELVQPLRWVEEIRRSQPARLGWNGHWPSITTQYVVGPAGESDRELLVTTAYLHRELRLARAYFSAFSPIRDTPLENHPPENPIRQNRLYQASFLLRDYGFTLQDIPLDENGNLALNKDPKTAWAESHLAQQPVEVNLADRSILLRVPGIGPKGADAILAARRRGKLTSIDDLQKIGVLANRAIPYILLDGHRPDRQLKFNF